jgi:hypothetical protein
VCRSQQKYSPLLIHTKHFDALKNEHSTSWLEPTTGKKYAKLLGLKSEHAKALWRYQEKTWMPKAAHDQVAYLIDLINHSLQGRYRWFRPISHIVRRKEDQLQYQDVSSKHDIGGHTPSHQVYWTLAWTNFGPAIAKWIKTTLNQGGNKDAHIKLARTPHKFLWTGPRGHLRKGKSYLLASATLPNRRQRYSQQNRRKRHRHNQQPYLRRSL